MKIGITYDLKTATAADGLVPPGCPDDFQEEFDSPATIEAIASVLRGLGHDVILMGDGRELLQRLLDQPPDFVFNFAEGQGISRSREARVPAVLEMLGIPYSGSDPLTMAVTLDKDCAKRLAASAGIAVPQALVISPQDENWKLDLPLAASHASTDAGSVGIKVGGGSSLALSHTSTDAGSAGMKVGGGSSLALSHTSTDAGSAGMKVGGESSLALSHPSTDTGSVEDRGLVFPVIVKPAWEGSSKGIRNKCLVNSPDELPEVIESLWADHRQPVLVEEYIEGDELTVGVLGNENPEILGIMRVVPSGASRRFIYSLEVKRDYRRRVRYECPAAFGTEATAAVRQAALKAFRVLGCRDVARIDFRLRNGVPYFLEVNPLPGLNPEDSDLVILAKLAGWSYERLIATILTHALARTRAPAQQAPAAASGVR